MRSSLRVAGVLVVGVLGLWGCGGGGGGGGAATPTSATPPAAQATTVTATIVGSIGTNAYSPNPVSAGAGAVLVFKNNDSQLHHIVLDNGSADLGDLAPGATSRTLAIANTNELRFHCTLHPSMVGTINGAVLPDPPCVDQYGYTC